MTDVQKEKAQTEKNSERKTPDSAAEAGVISGQVNQNAHGIAHEVAHAHDKNLTDPGMIAIKDGATVNEHIARVAQIQTNRFGIYDSSHEKNDSFARGQLAAQATEKAVNPYNPPNGFGADGRWHFQNPRLRPGQDIAGEMKEWIRNDMQNVPRDASNSSWALSEPLLKELNACMQRKPDMTYMEYLTGIQKDRGQSPWTDVSFEGVEKAYAEFPALAKHNIPKELISGIILNEVLHGGDPRDLAEELSVKLFGTVRDWNGKEKQTASVGPAQIQIQNIHHLVEKYPELSKFKKDPVRAAADPETTPMFVAAYISDKIDRIERYNKEKLPGEQIPIIAATVAYLYNPDVASSNNQYRQIDTFDKMAATLHIDTRKGWKTETMPNDDEIIRHSKVIQDILNATKACYR